MMFACERCQAADAVIEARAPQRINSRRKITGTWSGLGIRDSFIASAKEIVVYKALLAKQRKGRESY